MKFLEKRKFIAFGAAAAMLFGTMLASTPALAQGADQTAQPSTVAAATSDGAKAPSASSSDVEALRTLLKKTTVANLVPLASGYRADDSGTAPYSSFTTNSEDVAALNIAREAAQKVVDNASATAEEVSKASSDLQSAFDAVRFIYQYTGVTGTNGERLYDTNGNLIQAHGAGIIRAKTSTLAEQDRYIDKNKDGYVYILCGEDKTDRLVAHGVRIYYSDDLMNWVDKGLGFQTYLGDQDLKNKLAGADPVYQKYYNTENIAADPDYANIYGKDSKAFANDSSNYNIASPQDVLDKLLWDLKALYGDGSNPTKTSCVFERPKMVYNEKTNRWIIWFHADGPKYGNEDTATYSKAKAGVAISTTSNPAGPYKYLGSFRMSPGNNTSNPGMARDMNLYVDHGKDENGDGVEDAYLIYASNENKDLTISLLDSTYTKLAKPVAEQKLGTSVKDGDTYNIIATNSKESPAPVKWNGHYYFIYSHTTGWAPNENEYTMSEGDNIMGPYHEIGTPFVDGDGYEQSHTNSFYTQSSTIVPFDESKGIFFYWGDRWFNPDTGNDISQSRYVMTPMQFVNGQMRVLPAADWSTKDADQYTAVDVVTKLPTSAGSVSDVVSKLPKELEVSVAGSSQTTMTPVTWDTYFGQDQPSGDVTLTGRLPEFGNAPVNFTVTIYPKNTYLFIDAGSDPANESDYFNELKKMSESVAKQDASDQAYTPTDGWGLVSVLGKDGDVQKYHASSNDIYETGLYANSGKSIVYQADLQPGVYTVQAGMKDWWAQWNDRNVTFTVSDGDTQFGSASVNLKNGQQSTKAITFTLTKAASVRFTASNGGTNLDPMLSWINVAKADASDVQSVQPVKEVISFLSGQKPSMPKTVTVTKADGTTEERKVTWQLGSMPSQSYVPTTVQGVVDGTTLPATATIEQFQNNLEYFIDVNGGDSSSAFDEAKKLNTGLSNGKADQVFDADSGWGNASTNYGLEFDGDANPFQSGIYAGKDGNPDGLSYKLTLPAGKHELSVGMHDWWGQTRPTTITYQYDGMQEPESLGTAQVGSDNTVVSGTITIPDGAPRVVTVTLTSSTGTGPVLSWISSQKIVNGMPRISGADAVHLTVGAVFDPRAGVTASDDEDGDLTAKIVITGSVDTQKAGTYTLTYTVTDSQQAKATVQRIVTVADAPSNPDAGGSGSGGAGAAKTPGNKSTGPNGASSHRPELSNTGSTVTGISSGLLALLTIGAGVLFARRRFGR